MCDRFLKHPPSAPGRLALEQRRKPGVLPERFEIGVALDAAAQPESRRLRGCQRLDGGVGAIGQRVGATEVVHRDAVIVVELGRLAVHVDGFVQPARGVQAVAQVEPCRTAVGGLLGDSPPCLGGLFPTTGLLQGRGLLGGRGLDLLQILLDGLLGGPSHRPGLQRTAESSNGQERQPCRRSRVNDRSTHCPYLLTIGGRPPRRSGSVLTYARLMVVGNPFSDRSVSPAENRPGLISWSIPRGDFWAPDHEQTCLQ